MIAWIKKLLSIVKSYDSDLRRSRVMISDLEAIIRDRTDIAVDVGFRDASHVIVVGRYRNTDYIQTFSVNTPDLAHLIDRLHAMERHGVVRRIDAPPSVKAVFHREFR
jgi:hypothetical protein